MPSRPRPIIGTTGSLARVTLGATGNNWLLVTTKDDGETIIQNSHWRNIPSAVNKQLHKCVKKGRLTTEVSFGPSEAWYIHATKDDGSCGHCWWGGTTALDSHVEEYSAFAFGTDGNGDETWFLSKGANEFIASQNCPDGLKNRAQIVKERGGTILRVRLFGFGGFFIRDDTGYRWCVSNECLANELSKSIAAIEDVAFAEDGSWVILFSDKYTSQGVDERLTSKLDEFFVQQTVFQRARKEAIEEYDLAERGGDDGEDRFSTSEDGYPSSLEDSCDDQENMAQTTEQTSAAREPQGKQGQKLLEEELGSLQDLLEHRLLDESRSIDELEKHVLARKRALVDAIGKMPLSRRIRMRRNLCGSESSGVCVVCQVLKASIAIVPCGHMCLCQGCATELTNREESCPLCRGEVSETLKIYTPLGNTA